MQCLEFQFNNPGEAAFCCKCGSSLSSGGGTVNDHEFAAQGRKTELETGTNTNCYEAPDSERKCVTGMFSGLTGYTEMSEKLDPEEVKEITSAIFSELIDRFDNGLDENC